MNKLTIIIPVFNESENVTKLIPEIRRAISTSSRILIVYDFDEDNTLPAVKSIQDSDSEVFLLKNIFGNGALNAIKSGFSVANSPYVLVMMADLSDDLNIVDKMVQKMDEGYDIVCGSRYMKGGQQIGGPLVKKTLSWLAGISLFYFTGIPTHDATNSFKMYRQKVLKDIPIESRGGFELGLELVTKAYNKGFKITEIPSVWYDRTDGKSRFRLWAWLPSYLKWYFKALLG